MNFFYKIRWSEKSILALEPKFHEDWCKNGYTTRKKPQKWTLKNDFSEKSQRILKFWKKFLKTHIKRANLAETDISGHEIYPKGPSRAMCFSRVGPSLTCKRYQVTTAYLSTDGVRKRTATAGRGRTSSNLSRWTTVWLAWTMTWWTLWTWWLWTWWMSLSCSQCVDEHVVFMDNGRTYCTLYIASLFRVPTWKRRAALASGKDSIN